MTPASIETIAGRLDTARRTHTPIPPITESEGITSVETAYAIQTHWTNMRLARGEKIVGRKIGLTSKAIQQQLGVSEPDYGTLWESSFYRATAGRVEIPASEFLQPRIEGEVAFLFGRSLPGPNITVEDVLAATEACALGVEIVASRIADWRIKLVDTIADNAMSPGAHPGDQTDVSRPGRAREHRFHAFAEAATLGQPPEGRHAGTRIRPVEPGQAVSSGCIRLFNQDIIDLYNRVPIGTRVTVVQR